MTSPKQLEANRSNASKSTGPRTSAGKARVSKNPMKHGLAAAKFILIGNENEEEFKAFEDLMFDAMNPTTALQGDYARRIVANAWRLRRIPQIEAAWFAFQDYVSSKQRIPHKEPDGTPRSPEYIASAEHIDLGRLVHSMFQQGISERLTRYQVSLRNQVAQDLAELKALQAEDAVELEAVAAAEVSSEPEAEGETESG
jgi:hypothetical protein